MRYVFLVSNKETKEPLALYSTIHTAKKLMPEIEKKLNVKTELTKMTVDLTLDLIGVRK